MYVHEFLQIVKRRTTRPLRSSTTAGTDFLKVRESGGQSWLRSSGSFDYNASYDGDGDYDVLDIDIAVKNSKIRSRRCKSCSAGGEVTLCSQCDSPYHFGICVPLPTSDESSKSRLLLCPNCSMN